MLRSPSTWTSRTWRALPAPARHLARSGREIWRRVRVWPADALDAWRDPGALRPPRALQFVGDGDFETIGAEFLGHFVHLGGLHSTDRVLDIGCGVGRMAIPLTRVLDGSARYDGFDVVRAGVAWCTARVTPRFPHFHFHHLDVRNARYNPRGRTRARDVRFPCDDGQVDFAFATSLFTHLLAADTERYLAEIARVLRPGGRALCTFFLLNDEVRARLDSGFGLIAFPIARDGHALRDEDVPENAVAYDEPWLRQRCAWSGLAIASVHRGSWSGADAPATFQDIVVMTRASDLRGTGVNLSDSA